MFKDNLLKQDRITPSLTSNSLKNNLVIKNCLCFVRRWEDKEIKWKLKFMFFWIFKLKNQERLIRWRFNYVIVNQAKELFNKS